MIDYVFIRLLFRAIRRHRPPPVQHGGGSKGLLSRRASLSVPCVRRTVAGLTRHPLSGKMSAPDDALRPLFRCTRFSVQGSHRRLSNQNLKSKQVRTDQASASVTITALFSAVINLGPESPETDRSCKRGRHRRVFPTFGVVVHFHASGVRSVAGGSSYPNSRPALSDGCNGLRTRSLKPRPVTVSNRPTVTPLSRAQLLHQVQTRRIRHHPPADCNSPFNKLAPSELRRMFCSDVGVSCAHFVLYSALRWRVAQKLALQWSPQQISGWLKQEFPTHQDVQISHEAIYRSPFSSRPAAC